MITPRLLSVVALAAAFVLLAAGCGDDSTLEELIEDIESEESQATPTSSTSPSESDPGEAASDQDQSTQPETDADTDSRDSTLTESEQTLIDYLASGDGVLDSEAQCLVEGLAAEGIEPGDVVTDVLDVDEEIIVTDVILSCFEEPEGLQTFVKNIASGFGDLAPFDIQPDEAACTIAAIIDHGVTAAQVASSEIPLDLIEELNTCIGIDLSFAFETGDVYGDNPVLDELWDECESGIMASCDELYSMSEIGSQYETFGASCGDREPDSSGGACDIPFSYGDNAELDAYWDACEAGDGTACDDLYFESPIGSEYEEFGASCGNRHEGTQNYCADLLG